jgi:hypothetical protein
MKKLITTVIFIAGFLLSSSAQTTFTTYLNSFTWQQTGDEFVMSPRAIIQLPDSSYRLLVAHRKNTPYKYWNAVAVISREGSLIQAHPLNTPSCYWGGISAPCVGNKSNFIYFDVPDYCSGFRISKVDTSGNPIWQKITYSTQGGIAEYSDKNFSIVNQFGDFILYNLSGDSINGISGGNMFPVKELNDKFIAWRYSDHNWMYLTKNLGSISNKNDSLVGIKANGVCEDFEVSHEKKHIYSLYSHFSAELASGWKKYIINSMDSNFNLIKTDTITIAKSWGYAKIRSLTDGSLLVVCPTNDNFLKVLKYSSNLVKIYDFTITSKLMENFGVSFVNSIGLNDIITTLDHGYALTAMVNLGPYATSTLFIKFDSLGNFYWPSIATGVKEVLNIPHRAYPNPATEQVIFELTERGDYELTVADVSGTVVHKTSLQDNKQIATVNWNKGIYFYTLSNKDKVTKGKIIKF